MKLTCRPKSTYQALEPFPPLSKLDDREFEASLRDRPTILYFHGNVRPTTLALIPQRRLIGRQQTEQRPIEFARILLVPLLITISSQSIIVDSVIRPEHHPRKGSLKMAGLFGIMLRNKGERRLY